MPRIRLADQMKNYWHVYASLLIVAGAGIVLAWINRNQINPDAVGYIQAAQHYANFDVHKGVNGYWSPLLSWLLVPFIWLHVEPLFAFRFINFLLAIGVVSSVLYYLNIKHRANALIKFLQLFFVASFGIVLMEWGSAVVTPDILSGVVLLFVIWRYYKYLSHNTVKNAAILGVAFSMLYFAKYVNFYVSVLCILILVCKSVFSQRRMTKPTLTLICVFVSIAGIWVGALSLKYHTITPSMTNAYARAIFGPERPSHPITNKGYLPTRYENDIWSWSDPSYYSLPSWKTTQHIGYFVENALLTTNKALQLLFSASPLIFLGLLAIFIRKKDKFINEAGYLLIFISIALVIAYSFVLYVEQRYIWLIAIPIISFGAVLIKDRLVKPAALLIVLSIIFASSVLTLVPYLLDGYQKQLNEGSIKYLATKSRQIVPEYASIAGPYPENYQYCYFSTTRCLGNYTLTGVYSSDSRVLNKMREHGIEYYIDYSSSKSRLSYLRVVYQKSSSKHSCYDYTHDITQPCGKKYLTIYKL